MDWQSLIFREYELLQRAIDKLDGQRFQIRGWAITVAGVAFTVSLSVKQPLIAFLGVFTTSFFAFLEVVYMQMEVDVIRRSNALEDLIKEHRRTGNEPPGYVFGVSQAFAGTFSFRSMPDMIFSKDRMHVGAFYAALFFATLAGGIGLAAR